MYYDLIDELIEETFDLPIIKMADLQLPVLIVRHAVQDPSRRRRRSWRRNSLARQIDRKRELGRTVRSWADRQEGLSLMVYL